MPRSFLVKKYFSNKKPYYRESQQESQTGMLFYFTLMAEFHFCFEICTGIHSPE